MTMDEGIIQADVSEAGVEPAEGASAQTVLPAVPPVSEEVKPEYLTKEGLKAALEEIMPAYLNPMKDTITQSAKDRVVNELRKKAKKGDTFSKAIRERILPDNPELADKLRIAELEAGEEANNSIEEESETVKKQEEAAKQVHAGLIARLSAFGIDPGDKRIDWAKDTRDYNTGMKRFEDSVARIIKDNAVQLEANLKKKYESESAAKIAAREKELGIESVTLPDVAAVTDNDAWLKSWGDGTIPATKENIAKALKLMNS
jgi:hypothetical protein